VLARDDVTDIYVNKPGELWIETIGGAIEQIDAPGLTPATLDRLARQIAALSQLLDSGDIAGMLSLAVKSRKNILVSGGTSTGKTTFLNALIREIPAHERLILIEDTPELHLGHANAVGLLAARSALGEAQVTADSLLAASLRMRPDRIIVGELRGPEAYTFLRAVNTGHPGSMTTVHADSAERAIEQIALLVLQTGTRLGREDVSHYVRTTVDVFVQLARTDGRRHVAEVVLAR
jgi:type IV secretion system protein VirB11